MDGKNRQKIQDEKINIKLIFFPKTYICMKIKSKHEKSQEVMGEDEGYREECICLAKWALGERKQLHIST